MTQTVASFGLPVGESLKIVKNRFKGGASPTRVCIVTGTHGDELEGQYICCELGRYLKENSEKLDGTVDIYPALNPLGIDSIMRGIPGCDLDMNRTFPGMKFGTAPEMAAHEIVEDIKGADVCIDIHSSNIFLRELPQIRISVPMAKALLPYAVMLNVDFVWIHESATVLESTLAHSLNSIGVKTLVVEMGVGMRITKEYCSQLTQGIINLLTELGMLSGVQAPKVRKPIVSTDGLADGEQTENTDRAVSFVNSPTAGIFVPSVGFGSAISEGDALGDVLDPMNAGASERIYAPCSGLLFTLREYPVVYDGSLIARILKRREDEA